MASTREFTIKTYFEREVQLDDGSADPPRLPIRIRRFNIAQLQAFIPGFELMTNPPSERVFARLPDGPEQEEVVDESTGQVRYRVPFVEVRRRRLAEMTPEQRAVWQASSDADQAAILDFCRGVVAEHVWPAPSVRVQLEDDDGTRRLATTGDDLVAAFEGNLSMLMALTKAVADENLLPAHAKKAWRSSSSSRPSSSTPQDRGATPGPTARPAGSVGSAPRARARGRRRGTRSGLGAT